jgi:predicted AAA+ superfamily ATPase
MVFVVGPRQVGKTTLCRSLFQEHAYFNWDNQGHRNILITGPDKVAEDIGVRQLRTEGRVIVLDEIHKYSKWKNFIKGLFDVYGESLKIIVTGSSRLDIFKKGGDSLMGRYFLYRLHPLSVSEILGRQPGEREISPPVPVPPDMFDALYRFGGFPEPYLTASERFFNKWKRLRKQQLFREDIRDFSRVQEIHQIELLAEMLASQAGRLINYSNLAVKINVSADTIRRWIQTLESVYYCFTISPWSRNISRSLLKQPKVYLWDWSYITDPGQRAENFVASHLLKAINWWTDNGLGDYGLYFLRDKDKREVDFLITKNNNPWILIEVKRGADKSPSRELHLFQNLIGAPYAFQLSFSLDYADVDCFSLKVPMVVPVSTFLSQIV